MAAFHFVGKNALDRIPKTPGVYILKNKTGILYIGKAVNLQERVKNHARQTSYRDGLFMRKVRHIGYAETPSEIDALLMESALIKKHQPKYNVFWKDDKKYFYAAIATHMPPYIFITHQPYETAQITKNKTQTKHHPQNTNNTRVSEKSLKGKIHARYIGPYVDGRSLKRALRYLRKAFPYYTTAKHPSLRCGYCHLGLCPGPAPDMALYKKNLQRLIGVLKGKRTSVLGRLKKEMAMLSKNKQYEQAGIARDQIFALENIARHRLTYDAKKEKEEQQKQEYPIVERSLQKLFQTAMPMRRVEEFDISNIQGTAATGSMVVFVKGKRAPHLYRKFKVLAESKPNDFAMIKEIIARRMRHAEWGWPDLMIIDGGKGQLNAALSALAVRRRNFFVAALAKRKTELFLQGRKESVPAHGLPLPTQRFLLRIRDEAHRFAISYHKILRKKYLNVK